MRIKSYSEVDPLSNEPTNPILELNPCGEVSQNIEVLKNIKTEEYIDDFVKLNDNTNNDELIHENNTSEFNISDQHLKKDRIVSVYALEDLNVVEKDVFNINDENLEKKAKLRNVSIRLSPIPKKYLKKYKYVKNRKFRTRTFRKYDEQTKYQSDSDIEILNDFESNNSEVNQSETNSEQNDSNSEQEDSDESYKSFQRSSKRSVKRKSSKNWETKNVHKSAKNDYQNLISHKNVENIYKCGSCEEAFNQPDILKIHYEQVHSNNKRFKCFFCPFLPISADSLKKHIDSVHQAQRQDGLENSMSVYLD